MSSPNYTARFEVVGDLYYRATGRLRPGKSEPMATGRDSNDSENRARFDEWVATKCWDAAIDRIIELQARVEELEGVIDAMGETDG